MASRSEDVLLGPDASVSIIDFTGPNFQPIGQFGAFAFAGRSIPYAVISGRYRETTKEDAVTDNENDGYERVRSDKIGQFEVEIVAQREKFLSPHVPPFSIRAGNYIGFELQTGDNGVSYEIPRLLLTMFEGTFQVKGSEPQTIRLAGKSDGPYVVFGGGF